MDEKLSVTSHGESCLSGAVGSCGTSLDFLIYNASFPLGVRGELSPIQEDVRNCV